MLNYLEEYKTIFGGKIRQTIKHSENISPYSSYLWFSFDFCKIYKLNLLSDWFLVQCSKMSNLVDEYKTTFLGVWEKLLIIPKSIPILELLVYSEYWYKAKKSQIWSRNTESFFWDIDAIHVSFRRLSSHIGVTY